MMQKLASVLLAGLMTVLSSSCVAAPNSVQTSTINKDADYDNTADDTDLLAKTYQSDVDSLEKDVYTLSEVISDLPIQAQPISEEQKSTFSGYKKSLNSIIEKLAKINNQLQNDLKGNKLTKDNCTPIVFQINRLTDKIDLLRDTICIVYGTN